MYNEFHEKSAAKKSISNLCKAFKKIIGSDIIIKIKKYNEYKKNLENKSLHCEIIIFKIVIIINKIIILKKKHNKFCEVFFYFFKVFILNV